MRTDPDRTRRRATRPWLTLAVWALVVAALALLGAGIARRLTPSTLLVPGTPSARAQAMIERQFGNSVTVTVLLQGPPAAIDRQGPRLAAALRREPRVRVMSPWDSAETPASLRPRPGAALVVAGFQRPDSEALTEVVPAAQGIVRANVRPPVRAHVGGLAAVGLALQKDALDATHRAELLVAPILVLVLLLVFRSPVAAAIPLLMGGATVLAGRGLLWLSAGAMPINSLAVSVASMMGLALGVDYALLMVSRFRQERAGGEVDAAIDAAARAAGRTIVFAGGTLALAMLTAALIAPGDLLASVAAGVMVSALLSVLLAISLLPALIRILAPWLERWRLPGLGSGDRLVGLATRLVARPWIAIPLIVGAMLAIAAPAGALSIGPPDPRQLPRSDPTRQGYEALRREIGPGWAAPVAIVASARRGTISDPGRLRAISRWQDRVARDPAVEAVIGPASLREAEGSLAKARRGYRAAPAKLASAEDGIESLRSGLRDAGDGVARLRGGLGSAADGAATIAGRTREAAAGAARLEAGLGEAGAGARRLSAGLDRAVRGADRLVRGQRRLGDGAVQLARGARKLDRELSASLAQLYAIGARLRTWAAWIRSLRGPTEMAADRLERAVRELEAMTVGREDPRYAELRAAVREASALVGAPLPEGSPAEGEPVLPAGAASSLAGAIVGIEEQLAHSVDTLAAQPERLDGLAAGVSRLRAGADRVAAGARDSERGGRELRTALRRLARGGHRLDRGLARARGGGAQLAEGLEAIAGGADRLGGELRDGRARGGELAAGLERPQGPLAHYALALHGYREDLGALRAASPRAIDSGYLMLAALDGTVPETREQIAQVVNLDSGGQTARMLVVPASGPSAASTRRLIHRLQDELPALARASGTSVAIGEGAQTLADYSDATMARLPLLVIALSLVSVLMLTMVLRSLPLPLVAVALNLLTIAAAFGALQIFFGLDLLVGPRYIDAISAAGVLTIMFVLSVDYEVFLLTRMREAWLARRDHAYAIEHGLRRTAGVITGAAAIMSSVFLAFASADIASLQQFGAGLTFAVALDATVIRLVLLPAIMRALGPRAWWLPRWLDRALPALDPESSAGEAGPDRDRPPAGRPDRARGSAASRGLRFRGPPPPRGRVDRRRRLTRRNADRRI